MINKYIQQKILNLFPHNPTKEQITALESIINFLYSKDDQLLLLIGYAGTGKTSLVGAVIKMLNSFQQKTVLLAPTGRAAKVFAEYAGQKAYTIHKKIYRQKSFSNNQNTFSLSPNFHKDTIFFIDEASMISNQYSGNYGFGSGYLLDDLFQYILSGDNCKLLIMGDLAQLPPVSEKESPAFDITLLKSYTSSIQKITLTQVVRQDVSSGILYNATMIRKKISLAKTNSFPAIKTVGFTDLTLVKNEDLLDTISQSYGNYGIANTIIICSSNKRAVLYNKGVRSQILYLEEKITSGDQLLIVKNNYFWAEQIDEMDFIANGEIVEVVRCLRSDNLYGFSFADTIIRFEDYDLEMPVKILIDTLESEIPSLSKEQNDSLFCRVIEDYIDEKTKANKIKKLKTDPFYNAIQVKYAYAITCHKAQGGQWDNVFLDLGFIKNEIINESFYRWMYTAITRAKKHLYFINMPQNLMKNETNNSH